jgi:hypothetical protein
MSNGPKIIDLDKHRIKLALEGKPGDSDLDTDPLAYFEVVWGAEVYGWNAVCVDMEEFRKGVPVADLTLRAPEYSHEIELIIKNLRALANDICRQHRLNHILKPEDDQ